MTPLCIQRGWEATKDERCDWLPKFQREVTLLWDIVFHWKEHSTDCPIPCWAFSADNKEIDLVAKETSLCLLYERLNAWCEFLEFPSLVLLVWQKWMFKQMPTTPDSAREHGVISTEEGVSVDDGPELLWQPFCFILPQNNQPLKLSVCVYTHKHAALIALLVLPRWKLCHQTHHLHHENILCQTQCIFGKPSYSQLKCPFYLRRYTVSALRSSVMFRARHCSCSLFLSYSSISWLMGSALAYFNNFDRHAQGNRDQNLGDTKHTEWMTVRTCKLGISCQFKWQITITASK